MQIRLASVCNYDSIVDGPGLRIVIWTQGCLHKCPFCHNPITHNMNGGFLQDIDTLVEEVANYPLKSGVTISGGDPFYQEEATLYLVKKLKEHNINVWIYSGFTFEEILANEAKKAILNYVDVLVDGPFIIGLKKEGIKFRGSTNQRIIDVVNSLKTNSVVLAEQYYEK